MPIVKPSVLSSWLLGLNFSIFTWQLNIGDWIENALDWAISWVNFVLDRADAAYTWAQLAWDRAGELLTYANNYAFALFNNLSGRLDALWSQLGVWWSARRWELQQWVESRLTTLKSYINDVSSTLQRLAADWDTFRSLTLPSLVNLSWFRSWWGLGAATFTDWWSSARSQLREERTAELQPLRDEVRTHGSFLDIIRELIADPEKWLLDRMESMLARFI